MKLSFLHCLPRTYFDTPSSINTNVRQSWEALKNPFFIHFFAYLSFSFSEERLRKKGISLVSGSSAAQTSTTDAQKINPKIQQLAQREWPEAWSSTTSSVMVLKSFSNWRAFLEHSGHRQHPKNYLLGFFPCFFHFLFQFLLDFLFRKDREHFQNRVCSLESEQTNSKVCKALAGPYRKYPMSLPASFTAQ